MAETTDTYIKWTKQRIAGLSATMKGMQDRARDPTVLRMIDQERLRFAGILNKLEKEKRDDNH